MELASQGGPRQLVQSATNNRNLHWFQCRHRACLSTRSAYATYGPLGFGGIAFGSDGGPLPADGFPALASEENEQIPPYAHFSSLKSPQPAHNSGTSLQLLRRRQEQQLAARALTKELTNCKTIADAQTMYEEHGSNFNAIHFSALFTTLARLADSNTQPSSRTHHFANPLPAASPHPTPYLIPTSQLRSRPYNLTSHDRRSLHLFLSQRLVPDLGLKLMGLGPRQLSNVLVALAHLGYTPPAFWLSEWLQHFERRLRADDGDREARSSAPTSMELKRAGDGGRDNRAVQTGFGRTGTSSAASSGSGSGEFSCTPGDLAQAMWALACLRTGTGGTGAGEVGEEDAQAATLTAAAAAAESVASTPMASSASTVPAAVSTVHTPTSYTVGTAPQCTSYNATGQSPITTGPAPSNLISSSYSSSSYVQIPATLAAGAGAGAQHVGPSLVWLDAVACAMAVRAPAASAADIAAYLWAAARLGYRPGHRVMAALLSRCQELMRPSQQQPAAGPQSGSEGEEALHGGGAGPRTGAEAGVGVIGTEAGELKESRVGEGISGRKEMVGGGEGEGVVAEGRGCGGGCGGGSMGPRELSGVLWALVKLGFKPEASWLVIASEEVAMMAGVSNNDNRGSNGGRQLALAGDGARERDVQPLAARDCEEEKEEQDTGGLDNGRCVAAGHKPHQKSALSATTSTSAAPSISLCSETRPGLQQAQLDFGISPGDSTSPNVEAASATAAEAGEGAAPVDWWQQHLQQTLEQPPTPNTSTSAPHTNASRRLLLPPPPSFPAAQTPLSFRQAATCAWALARLGHRPPTSVLAALLQHTCNGPRSNHSAATTSARFSNTSSATTTTSSSSTTTTRPSSRTSFSSSPSVPSSSSGSTSATNNGAENSTKISTSNSRPSGSNLLLTAAPQDLSMLAFALGVMRFRPHPNQLLAVMVAMAIHLPNASPQDLVVWLAAMTRLRVAVPEPWVAAYLRRTAQVLERIAPLALVNWMEGLARLRTATLLQPQQLRPMAPRVRVEGAYARGGSMRRTGRRWRHWRNGGRAAASSKHWEAARMSRTGGRAVVNATVGQPWVVLPLRQLRQPLRSPAAAAAAAALPASCPPPPDNSPALGASSQPPAALQSPPSATPPPATAPTNMPHGITSTSPPAATTATSTPASARTLVTRRASRLLASGLRRRLLRVTAAQMASLDLQQLCRLAWALARLRVPVHGGWVNALIIATTAALQQRLAGGPATQQAYSGNVKETAAHDGHAGGHGQIEAGAGPLNGASSGSGAGTGISVGGGLWLVRLVWAVTVLVRRRGPPGTLSLRRPQRRLVPQPHASPSANGSLLRTADGGLRYDRPSPYASQAWCTAVLAALRPQLGSLSNGALLRLVTCMVLLRAPKRPVMGPLLVDLGRYCRNRVAVTCGSEEACDVTTAQLLRLGAGYGEVGQQGGRRRWGRGGAGREGFGASGRG